MAGAAVPPASVTLCQSPGVMAYRRQGANRDTLRHLVENRGYWRATSSCTPTPGCPAKSDCGILRTLGEYGAGERIRTDDLRITSAPPEESQE